MSAKQFTCVVCHHSITVFSGNPADQVREASWIGWVQEDDGWHCHKHVTVREDTKPKRR